jgi:hypothetical protein
LPNSLTYDKIFFMLSIHSRDYVSLAEGQTAEVIESIPFYFPPLGEGEIRKPEGRVNVVSQSGHLSVQAFFLEAEKPMWTHGLANWLPYMEQRQALAVNHALGKLSFRAEAQLGYPKIREMKFRA